MERLTGAAVSRIMACATILLAAAAAGASVPAPDIAITARVRARGVKIEQ